jgi:hypothetical protein
LRNLDTHLCDFCGRAAPRVQRVALDRDYDRLSSHHRARYACEPCSRTKDEQRKRTVDAAPQPS